MTLDVTIPGLATKNESNTRTHWRDRQKRAKHQRAVVGLVLATQRPPAGPWRVTLTRVSPRALDTDGLAAALKAVRDAVASWLGVDDGPAAPVTWRVEQERGEVAVRVRVETWDVEARIAAAERELAALRGGVA